MSEFCPCLYEVSGEFSVRKCGPFSFKSNRSEKIDWKVTYDPSESQFTLEHLASCDIWLVSAEVSGSGERYACSKLGRIRMDSDALLRGGWLEVFRSKLQNRNEYGCDDDSDDDYAYDSFRTYTISVKYWTENSSCRRPFQLLNSLSSDFEKLVTSKALSDCVFQVGEEEIPAVKAVLSVRVPYFQKLFDSGMLEAITNRIQITDIDPDTFKQVLKFIYCGQLPNDLDTRSEIYLPVAEMYGIDDLKNACSSALLEGLTKENAARVTVMADLYRCPALKEACFKLLVEWRGTLSDEQLAPIKDNPDLMFELIKRK